MWPCTSVRVVLHFWGADGVPGRCPGGISRTSLPSASGFKSAGEEHSAARSAIFLASVRYVSGSSSRAFTYALNVASRGSAAISSRIWLNTLTTPRAKICRRKGRVSQSRTAAYSGAAWHCLALPGTLWPSGSAIAVRVLTRAGTGGSCTSGLSQIAEITWPRLQQAGYTTGLHLACYWLLMIAPFTRGAALSVKRIR